MLPHHPHQPFFVQAIARRQVVNIQPKFEGGTCLLHDSGGCKNVKKNEDTFHEKNQYQLLSLIA